MTEASLTGMIWDVLPTLHFDEDCPKSIQLLFTGSLGAAVGIVLYYILSEIYRIVFEE